MGYFRGTKFSRIAQTKHFADFIFEDRCSNYHTPTLSRDAFPIPFLYMIMVPGDSAIPPVIFGPPSQITYKLLQCSQSLLWTSSCRSSLICQGKIPEQII